jgi:hypothetical protein
MVGSLNHHRFSFSIKKIVIRVIFFFTTPRDNLAEEAVVTRRWEDTEGQGDHISRRSTKAEDDSEQAELEDSGDAF